MKNAITDIYKVNGVSFTNYSHACEAIRNNNFRVTTTETINHKGVNIHLMNVTAITEKHPLQVLADTLKNTGLSANNNTQLNAAVKMMEEADRNRLTMFVNSCEGADGYEKANNAFKQLQNYF